MKTRHIALAVVAFAHVVVVAACATGIVDDGLDGSGGFGTTGTTSTTTTGTTTSTTDTTTGTTTSTTTGTTTTTTSTSSTTTSTTTTTTTSTTTVGGCLPFWEIDCGNGNCVSIFWTCDGFDDCGNGADESVSLCSSGVPAAWNCSTSYYDAADGCDCGCGAPDPDCASPSASACDYCSESGSCAVSCSDINPNDNSICL